MKLSVRPQNPEKNCTPVWAPSCDERLRVIYGRTPHSIEMDPKDFR